MSPRGQRLALLLAAIVALAVVVTLIEDTPSRLPGVALGSAVLLHVERVAALFAIAVAIISVLTQATRGRLPTQLSTGGLAYEADAVADTKIAVEDLQGQVDELQRQIATLADLTLGDQESGS